MSDINDADVYAIDDLTEREIEKIEEEKNKGSGNRHIYLTPGKKETSRTTALRPAFKPNNKYGQPKPMMQVRLHEGLDKFIPGTKRRPFPNIKPGTETVVCLNEHKEDNFCHVCNVEGGYRSQNYEIRDQANSTGLRKDQVLHEKFRNWFSRFKSTLWHYFIAIRLIGPVPEGEEWNKGKLPVKKDPDARGPGNTHGLVKAGKDDAEIWVDPIAIVRIKDWWITPLINLLNQREMTHQSYERSVGRKVSQIEYLRECPKLRPLGPFHNKEGYVIECTVNGKGKDQVWSWSQDKPEPLTKEQQIAIIADYPNMMSEVAPHGEDRVEPLEEWLKKNKGKTKIEWELYRKQLLSEAQYELLGLDKADVTDKEEVESLEEMTGNDGSVQIEEGDGGDSYSIPETGSDLDDLDLEEDIPF